MAYYATFKDGFTTNPVAIKDQSDFSSGAGWTLVGSMNTPAYAGNVGDYSKSSGDGWNAGVYRTSPITLDKGDTISFDSSQFHFASIEAVFGIRDTPSTTLVTGTEGYWFYYHSGPLIASANITNDNSINSIPDSTYYNFKIVCDQSTGFLTYYAKLNTDVSFTLIGHLNTDLTGTPLYFSLSLFAANMTVNFKNYLWTGLTSLWTVSQINGTVTLNNGNWQIAKTSGNALDQTYIRRTADKAGANGDIIFAIVSVDETFDADSLAALGQRNGGNVATDVGVRFYKTAGNVLELAVDSLGTGTDHSQTPAAWTVGTHYIFYWVLGASSYTFSVVGGSEYPTKVDLITAGSSYYTDNPTSFRMGPYNPSNDCSIYAYGWCDSGGPTPDAPTTPTSSATGQTTVDVGWANVDIAIFETGFKVERSLTSGSGFSVVSTKAFGTTTFGDTGLTAGTTYYYKIRSYFTFSGTDYYSSYTSETSVTTDAAPSTGPSPLFILELA